MSIDRDVPMGRRRVATRAWLAACVTLVSCSSTENTSTADSLKDTVDAETSAPTVTTEETVDDQPVESSAPDACSLVSADDVAAAGIQGVLGEPTDAGVALDIDPTVASTACSWTLGADGSGPTLALIVEQPAMSDVFEQATADPLAEDPGDLPGLGEQAAYAQSLDAGAGGAPTSWLVVRSGDIVFQLRSDDSGAVGRDQMVNLATRVVAQIS